MVAVFRAAKPLNDCWTRARRALEAAAVAGACRRQAVAQTGAIVVDEQMCDLLLIRHGRSADVVPGSDESLDPPLHDLGHRQAEALARRCRTRSSPRSTLSDLVRAVQTAGYLAMSRDVEVQQRQDLRGGVARRMGAR